MPVNPLTAGKRAAPLGANLPRPRLCVTLIESRASRTCRGRRRHRARSSASARNPVAHKAGRAGKAPCVGRRRLADRLRWRRRNGTPIKGRWGPLVFARCFSGIVLRQAKCESASRPKDDGLGWRASRCAIPPAFIDAMYLSAKSPKLGISSFRSTARGSRWSARASRRISALMRWMQIVRTPSPPATLSAPIQKRPENRRNPPVSVAGATDTGHVDSEQSAHAFRIDLLDVLRPQTRTPETLLAPGGI
jgi:hypothetical protein